MPGVIPVDIETYIFVVLTLLRSTIQFCLGTAITSETTSIVSADMKGTLLSLEHSIFAAARVVGPTIAIYVLEQHQVTGLNLLCAGVCAVTIPVARYSRSKAKQG